MINGLSKKVLIILLELGGALGGQVGQIEKV